MGQQLCGINSVGTHNYQIMAFAPSILATLGFDQPDISGFVVTSVGFVSSVIFAPMIHKFRRKLLWMIGFVLMMISFIAFLISQDTNAHSALKVFFLCMFVSVFQLGPGPVVWFISVEMFPVRAVAAAQGVATFFNWVANTIVFLIFPILLDKIGDRVLIVFIVFQILVLIYSTFFVMETLDRTPEDVLDDYQSFNFFSDD
ncbi:Solute carrier family 2, facilitated glucose transporter member 3 [Thelohanellus kitauei]|uniref:Solute carrier family 2, facilitated glucose transporter member 3 n=1 Tax=Thelohanellus kitauei TaxID=669202 RepID=A0A0C2IHR7_THEKT|nr:Solute carrier family 2, facilitated glucose transporter member 3 [Thelohanellus kitauei]